MNRQIRQRQQHVWMLAMVAMTSLGLGCEPEESGTTMRQPDGEEVTCADGDGRIFDEEGQELCVIPQEIIEVGFDCPAQFVGLQTYGQLAICGGGPTISPGKIDFSYSATFRDDLELVYPTFVPRGACASTLCGGLALCVSTGECEMVTSVNQAAFMCADGICTLEDVASSPSACDASCTPDCTDQAQWICAEDGARYCSACTTSCYGQQEAAEASTCPEPPSSRIEACIMACGDACGASAEEWFCASDGRYYCSGCEVNCLGHAVAPPKSCEGALPPTGLGDGM